MPGGHPPLRHRHRGQLSAQRQYHDVWQRRRDLRRLSDTRNDEQFSRGLYQRGLRHGLQRGLLPSQPHGGVCEQHSGNELRSILHRLPGAHRHDAPRRCRLQHQRSGACVRLHLRHRLPQVQRGLRRGQRYRPLRHQLRCLQRHLAKQRTSAGLRGDSSVDSTGLHLHLHGGSGCRDQLPPLRQCLRGEQQVLPRRSRPLHALPGDAGVQHRWYRLRTPRVTTRQQVGCHVRPICSQGPISPSCAGRWAVRSKRARRPEPPRRACRGTARFASSMPWATTPRYRGRTFPCHRRCGEPDDRHSPCRAGHRAPGGTPFERFGLRSVSWPEMGQPAQLICEDMT